MDEWLSYREAAKLTGKSIVSIKRWRRNGMPMGWEIREGQRYRVVRKAILQKWWRERMTADPVWQNKLRRLLNENE